MLLTKRLTITPSCANLDYYEAKGYKIPRYWSPKHKKWLVKRGTQIEVDAKDLRYGSHAKVKVKCDYCDNIKIVAYKDYLINHDEVLGDCCVKCRKIKYKKTMLDRYGVDCSARLPDIKERIKATNRRKYGCDWQMQSDAVQAKSRQTMKEKYGVEHALQVKEFSEKAMKTRCANHKNPTSKPQLALSHLLLEMYGNCELERPCGRCSLDCVVVVDDILIDIEYDGWFYHQDARRDIRRDNFVAKQGYKILRIKSNKHDTLPTPEQIDEKIQMLLRGHNHAVIQM